MARLRLSLACWNYDRTRALADGSVRPEGIDLNYLDLHVEETFFRMLRNREFDVAEMSLSSYAVSVARDSPPFVAIPVFPSRFFRHSCIFVSEKSAIREPRDLIGKRIGTPEYQMTAPVWIRGILQDEYGVDPASVEYCTGGEEEPGREEKLKLDLPAKFRVTRIGAGQTLSAMLADGEIDALAHGAHPVDVPQPARHRPAPVRELRRGRARLLPKDADLPDHAHGGDTPRRLQGQPLDRAIAVPRRSSQAKQRVYQNLYTTSALTTMLPWQIAQVEEVRRDMGDDWWPYGFEPNRHVLDTFLRYHHEQGLSPRRLQPEELFAPETLSSFRI